MLALVLVHRELNWPLFYLVLPLEGNPQSKGFLNLAVEKVVRRLDG